MKFQQETADSCSKPDGTEEVKEIIPLSHQHRVCRNDTDLREKQRLEPDARATTEGGRITEDGTDHDARQQAGTLPRKIDQQGEKAKNGCLSQ